MHATFVKYLPSRGYIQKELMICLLGRKHENLALFWKIYNSYTYASVDYDTINILEDVLLVESVIWTI